MIVPGTFMKKALKGELPLLQVAQNLQQELLMLMPEDIGTEPLAQEKYLVKNAKKIAVLAAGLAAQRFGAKLDQEQEVLVNIANIANQLFAMESAVLRTEKAIARDGAEKAHQNCSIRKSSVRKHSQRSKRSKRHNSCFRRWRCSSYDIICTA